MPTSIFDNEIEGFLIDLYGVIYQTNANEDIAVNGSVEAIKILHELGVPIKFVSNVSTRDSKLLGSDLRKLGYDLADNELFHLVPFVVNYLRQHQNLRPYMIVDPKIRYCFEEFDQTNPNCVIIGDSQNELSFENMNRAFQILLENSENQLIGLGMGKFYFDHEKGNILDAGPFIKALEFACNRKAIILGKPSKDYYKLALEAFGLPPEKVLMVGDDIYLDVVGSQANGLRAVIVRTGNYKPEHENDATIKPDAFEDNLLELVKKFAASR